MSDAPPSSPIKPLRPLPDPTWRERADALVEWLRDRGAVTRAVLGLVAAVIVAVVAMFVLRSSTAPPATEDVLPRASVPSAAASSAPSTTAPAVLVVQAAGAVVTPGVYRVPMGARVDDLVRAAGGLAPDADADRVNLAALLEDGQKIYIARIGEPMPIDVAPVGGASS